MERYIGLDVHTQSCTLAVVGPSGRRLHSEVVETNAKVLVDRIRAVGGRRHVCMEEGTQSAWLHEVLEPNVAKLVVVVPSARRGNKSDAHDAWALAEQLRRGAIDAQVFKSTGRFSELRQVVRGYEMVTQDVVRVKNRLRSVYRSRGLGGIGEGLFKKETRGSWEEGLPSGQRSLARFLGAELDGLLELRQAVEERLHAEAGKHPVVRQIATAPGIGPIRAAQIVAVVVTPERFRTKRQFWSYCGLGIVMRSSADWVRDGAEWTRSQVVRTRGLNRNRHPLLKSVFKNAALAVTRMKEHPLHQDYKHLLEAGTKPNLARLTIARRIASAVLAMWKKREVYDRENHRRTPTA
jgi:transposase